MSEIVRNRTIRPSSRLEKSKSYKIDTKRVSRGDMLVVNIDHESKPFHKTYRFNGVDVANKDSISFRVNDTGTSIDISWSGAQPIGKTSIKPKGDEGNELKAKPLGNEGVKPDTLNLKTSFEPISDLETTVLILGSMPGDESISIGEYYRHPRNKFWKIISTITKNKIPLTYPEKKELLLKTRIGIWDVAHKAERKGSLDTAIKNEIPNDIELFISKHLKLRAICFNGVTAQGLFDKYFSRKPTLIYLTLPSTSSANTGIAFDEICKRWEEIVSF